MKDVYCFSTSASLSIKRPRVMRCEHLHLATPLVGWEGKKNLTQSRKTQPNEGRHELLPLMICRGMYMDPSGCFCFFPSIQPLRRNLTLACETNPNPYHSPTPSQVLPPPPQVLPLPLHTRRLSSCSKPSGPMQVLYVMVRSQGALQSAFLANLAIAQKCSHKESSTLAYSDPAHKNKKIKNPPREVYPVVRSRRS